MKKIIQAHRSPLYDFGSGVTSVNGQSGVVVLDSDDIAQGSVNLYRLFNNLAGTVAPDASDDSSEGYQVGSMWIDTVASKVYTAISVGVGVAVWVDLTGGGGAGAWSVHSSGSESVSNNTETTLSTFTGDIGKQYFLVVRGSDHAGFSSDIQWGYYETDYDGGTGIGQVCLMLADTGTNDYEAKVRFNQGGMGGAEGITWTIYEASDS